MEKGAKYSNMVIRTTFCVLFCSRLNCTAICKIERVKLRVVSVSSAYIHKQRPKEEEEGSL